MTELITVDEASLPVESRYRPKPSNTGRITIMILLVAGIGFVIANSGQVPPPWNFWIARLAVVPSVLFGVVAVYRVVQTVRLNARWLAALPDLDRHLANGDLASAEALVERYCQEARTVPFVHAAAVWRLGLLRARAGELDRAVSLLDAAARGRSLRLNVAPNSEADLLSDLGFLEALRGNTDRSSAAQQAAGQLVPPEQRASLLLIDAVLSARASRWDDVVEMIEERWRVAESRLTPHQGRIVRVLQAFATERLRAGHRSEAREGDIDRALSLARPAYPGELDYLGTAWPDMADFLRRHRVSDARAVGSLGDPVTTRVGSTE